jgi:hypothetical protein
MLKQSLDNIFTVKRFQLLNRLHRDVVAPVADIFGDVVSMLALPKLLFPLFHLPYRKNIPSQHLFHSVACIQNWSCAFLLRSPSKHGLSHLSRVVLSF